MKIGDLVHVDLRTAEEILDSGDWHLSRLAEDTEILAEAYGDADHLVRLAAVERDLARLYQDLIERRCER